MILILGALMHQVTNELEVLLDFFLNEALVTLCIMIEDATSLSS
jgi:hypothetical protein